MTEFEGLNVHGQLPVNDNKALNRSDMAILRTLFAGRKEEDITLLEITGEYSVRISRCLYRPKVEAIQDRGEPLTVYTVIYSAVDEETDGIFITSWEICGNGAIKDGFSRYVQNKTSTAVPFKPEIDPAEIIANFPFSEVSARTGN